MKVQKCLDVKSEKIEMSKKASFTWLTYRIDTGIYSNTETSLAMSTLAIWWRLVRSRDVSPHNVKSRVTSRPTKWPMMLVFVC